MTNKISTHTKYGRKVREQREQLRREQNACQGGLDWIGEGDWSKGINNNK